MDIEKIKSRINKLLALSRSPNPNEAAAALEMARNLMAEYDIGQADCGFFDAGESNARTIFRENPPRYEQLLIHRIRNAFGCLACYIISREFPRWNFVGLKHRAEIAAYISDMVLRQLRTARREYLKKLRRVKSRYRKTKRADDFCSAWVEAVTGKLSAFAGISDEEETEIQAYYNRSHPDLEKIKPITRTAGNPSDYYAGLESGNGVRLMHGVGVHTGGVPLLS